jgi:hypothetical protein
MAAESRRRLRLTARAIENWAPWIGAGLFLAAYHWWGKAPWPKEPDALLGASGGAAAVLIGFLATAKAIVLSLSGTRLYRTLRDAGYHEDMLNYILSATLAGLVFMVFSIAGFFVLTKGMAPPFWYPRIWFFLGTVSLLLFWRFTNILFRMLRHV